MTSFIKRPLAALLIIGFLAACSVSAEPDRLDAAAEIVPLTALKIEAPWEITAGESFDITVFADAPDGTVARVSAFGATTAKRLEVILLDGSGTVAVGPPLTTHAGTLLLAAGIPGNPVTLQVVVSPGPAAAPITAVVGPRTIVANEADFTMGTVMPTDVWGNPVADGTEVTFRVERGDGTVTRQSSTVDGGVASTRIVADKRSGRTSVSAGVGAVTGPVMTIDEVAGTPAEFRVSVVDRAYLADGLSTHRVETSVVTDLWGNRLPDGVVVELEFAGAGGRGTVTTTLQNGRAAAEFVAPSAPGPFTVSARVSGVDAKPVTIEFQPAFEDFPTTARRRGTAVEVTVGPVTETDGGWVPDGTAVIITDGSGRRLAESAIDDGQATVTVQPTDLQPGLTATVLGVDVDVETDEL